MNKETALEVARILLRIRKFELKIEELFLAGELAGFVHLSIGQEAIATGVCLNLLKEDTITSTHRGHGHVIAKGAEVKYMMAELYGRETGYCRGKGGSMHIADFSLGIHGANGVVGAGANLSVGSAMSFKMRNTGNVAVTFFGDGGSNRGTIHEAMNFAAVNDCPVIFVVENNHFASTTAYEKTTSVYNLADRAQGYGIEGVTINGNDVFEVYDTAKELIEKVRKDHRPVMLEAKTYRIKGHYVGDPEQYRDADDVKQRMDTSDPVELFRKQAIKKKLITAAQFKKIAAEIDQEMLDAIEFAKASDFPSKEAVFENLYTSNQEQFRGELWEDV